MERVLVSTFGSAGDLFPLVPVVAGLRRAGSEVRWALPSALALYVRLLGSRALVLGDAGEFAVFSDREIFDTRFDGWSSWRRTLVSYVAPSLAEGVHRLEAAFDRWRPDVVVTSGWAVAARVAAARRDIPNVELSIYPQAQRVGDGEHLARPVVRAVRDLAGADARLDRLLWGARCDALLHDAAVLGVGDGVAPVGYPYWDHEPGTGSLPPHVEASVDRPGPKVVVTLGSFIGHAQRVAWDDLVASLVAAGMSVLVVGAPRDGAEGNGHAVAHTGFVPLSLILPSADVVVHHGGLGTTFAALRAGVPAVVVPQAFDQSFNARLLEGIGCGVQASSDDLPAVAGAVQRLVDDAAFRAAASSVGGDLVPPDRAAAVATDVVTGVVR